MGLRSKRLFALLWKCFKLRRRNYFLSILEFVCPLFFVCIFYFFFREISSQPHSTIKTPKYSSGRKIIEIKCTNSSFKLKTYHVGQGILAYTPANNFTWTVVNMLIEDSEKSEPGVFDSSVELDQWMENETRVDGTSNNETVGILFLDAKSNIDNTFKYVIRTNLKTMTTNELKYPSYYEKPRQYTSSYNAFSGYAEGCSYLRFQAKVDLGLIKANSFNNIEKIDGEYKVQELPFLGEVFHIIITMLYFLLAFSYVFLVVSTVRDTVQEKCSGIKELTRIMGVASWMDWLHWMAYVMMIQLPVTIGMAIFLSVLKPIIIEANVFVVWLLFFLFTVDCIVLIFIVTCLFNRPIRATILCVFGWLFLHCSLFYFADHPANFETYEQVLLSLVPLKNLCWSLHSLASFKLAGTEWKFKQLFTPGFTGSNVSVGCAILIFISEIVAFGLVLLYLDALMPGRYGISKPFYFICSWCKFKLFEDGSYHGSSTSTSTFPKTFEPPPKDLAVGIEIRGLQKTYGWKRKIVAVENVDLDIYKGEITVLLGHNGAGKTTTLSMIAGMFSSTKGTILLEGKDIKNEMSQFRKSLGICTQHNLYFSKLTVIEHLIFFGLLKGLSFWKAEEDGTELLNLLNIAQKRNTTVKKLSGGMQRRLCLAVALTGNPKVLILDEPTSGLDPESRQHIWDIILQLRGERTVIITTHHMEEADVLGDRIVIMDSGKVVCCGTTMFLKKLYGTGYHIHVMKSPNMTLKGLTQIVEQTGINVGVQQVSSIQVDFIVKEEDVDKLPNFFTTLESNKSKGGIQGISVTCTTLEDVFIRAAELSSEGFEKNTEFQKQAVSDRSNHNVVGFKKTKGFCLYLQQLEALLMMQLFLIHRRYFSLILKTFFSCLFITSIALVSRFKGSDRIKQRSLNINLDLYPDFVCHFFFVDGYNKDMSVIAEDIIVDHKGEIRRHNISNENNTEEFMKAEAMKDYYEYCRHTLFALTFGNNSLTLHYQSILNVHLPAVAVNLMSNILLRSSNAVKKGYIEVVNHPFVTSSSTEEVCSKSPVGYTYITPLAWIFFVFCVFIIIMPDLMVLFTVERVTDFKNQQIISGVHPLLYCVAHFLFDFGFYMLNAFIWIGLLLIFGSEIVTWNSEPLDVLLLTLTLYGISGILFGYLFTFFFNSTVLNNALFIAFNFMFAVIPSFFVYMYDILRMYYDLTLGFFDNFLFYLLCLNPTFSALMCVGKIAIKVLTVKYIKECGPKEILGSNSTILLPTNNLLRPYAKSDPFGVLSYVHYLAFTWILYFGLIIIIDMNCLRTVMRIILKKRLNAVECPVPDEDVIAEFVRVREVRDGSSTETPLLRVEGLEKRYSCSTTGPKAVNQVSFLVSGGECFGLLGVNGAGKTTVFKILTGVISANYGDAYVMNCSLGLQKYKYFSHIGYCPQFSALLDDLTGEETLKVIAKISGIPRKHVNAEVSSYMSLLGISEHAKKCTHTYSGGTKRKLSAAMAFIGNSEVVFLDEPTTGVDPVSRRKLWSVVQSRQKAGQAMVFTSHTMEECEALCTRLTIMKDGKMQCIGPVQYLKTKFGQGYVVVIKLINPDPKQLIYVKEDFLSAFPNSEIKDENVNMINYQINDPKTPLSRIFSQMIDLRDKYEVVEDFIVSNLTLENLFLSFADKKN